MQSEAQKNNFAMTENEHLTANCMVVCVNIDGVVTVVQEKCGNAMIISVGDDNNQLLLLDTGLLP